MTLVPAMIEYLKAQAAVSAIVGDRIHEAPGPASHQKPRLTLQDISGTVERHMTAQSDLASMRVQINCYAAAVRERALLAEAVYGELGGHPGATLGSGDIETHMRSATLVDEGKIYQDATDASEVHVIAQRQDYMVSYRRTVPTFS
jgi:hypothetical protein